MDAVTGHPQPGAKHVVLLGIELRTLSFQGRHANRQAVEPTVTGVGTCY